ncbi:hypothetical protein OHB14_30215 [Streptomyces sp. NBC_01613]|uniref:hypothetical protein n=1 Tax=Streptomyces sp. NBC_01613 TaxID=2975896 RepID=UPI0038631F2D
MSGGSSKPGRRKAARPALQYEHRPGRPSEEKPKERGSWVFGCLVLPVFVALLAPLILIDQLWGQDIWGDLATTWPGGGYAFAATVGAFVPLVFAAFVAPLTRMNWKKSKPRSLAWAAGALPGLAAGYLLIGVIGATWRPKRQKDWDGACYSRGGPCWVHVEYPYLWAAGLLATLAVAALLIAVLVKYAAKSPTSPPTSLSTSEP